MNWNKVDFSKLPSPSYVIDCDILKKKLYIMKKHCDFLGIKPLISIKGFPLALAFKEMEPFIYGLSASSLFEAQLAKHLGKEIHIHAPAYKPDEITEVFTYCDHVVFNSLSQWKRYQNIAKKATGNTSIGLRINPEYSIVDSEIYNPCMPYSRFGATLKTLNGQSIEGIDGFHLHVMYDHDAKTFANVINNILERFDSYLPRLSWINLGGGQRLADEGYQTSILKETISTLTTNLGLEVYVEPCEAIVTDCGYLVSTVLDVVKNKKETAILDTSALCHMPDVLEMPYRPDIDFPQEEDNGNYSYYLAGVSCLAGDIIGEYHFKSPIQPGNKIVFSEMGAYTFAKENYFNGINHPAIVLHNQDSGFQIVKQFYYQDYEANYL